MLASCDEKKSCYVCGSVAQEEVSTLLRPLPGGGFTLFDERYHIGDFIYVKANCKDRRHDIAQIMTMDAAGSTAHITITFLERYDNFMHQTGTLILSHISINRRLDTKNACQAKQMIWEPLLRTLGLLVSLTPLMQDNIDDFILITDILRGQWQKFIDDL